MTKEDIINEYIPFMVRYVLKREDPPKGEKELIEFSQALGRRIIQRMEGVCEDVFTNDSQDTVTPLKNAEKSIREIRKSTSERENTTYLRSKN